MASGTRGPSHTHNTTHHGNARYQNTATEHGYIGRGYTCLQSTAMYVPKSATYLKNTARYVKNMAMYLEDVPGGKRAAPMASGTRGPSPTHTTTHHGHALHQNHMHMYHADVYRTTYRATYIAVLQNMAIYVVL